ncbi:hypothetical protein ScPMuIL_013231 [Solemya velum]
MQGLIVQVPERKPLIIQGPQLLKKKSKPDVTQNSAGRTGEKTQTKFIVTNGHLSGDEDTKPTGLYPNVSNIEKTSRQNMRGSSVSDNIHPEDNQPDNSVPDSTPVDSHSNCSSAFTDWEQNVSCTSDSSNLLNNQLANTTGDSGNSTHRSELGNLHERLRIKVEPESDDSVMVSDVQGLSAMEKSGMLQCGNRALSDHDAMTATQMDQYSTHSSDLGQHLVTLPESGNMYIAAQASSSVYYPPVNSPPPDINDLSFACSVTKLLGTEKAPRHPVTGKLVCSQCGAFFKCRSSLSRHKALHGEKRHRCFICKRAFHRKEHLSTHLERHAKNSEISCPICHIQGPNIQFLEKTLYIDSWVALTTVGCVDIYLFTCIYLLNSL